MIKIVEDREFPAEDDVIGNVALALAIHDVTEPPKAMTDEELGAFERMFITLWQDEKNRWILDKLQDFRAREKVAHSPTGGSYPIHYGQGYWRDYLKEAAIAIKTAEIIYGRRKMRGKTNQQSQK